MTYGDTNPSIYEWKSYKETETIVQNSHGLLELKFVLDDATLLGSSDYLEPMKEVISRYQARLDRN